MCGIAGVLDPSRRTTGAELEAQACAMTGTLSHRGPDDEGTWLDESAGVALGHRRLAVVDLTAAGHQPMASRDGRWVLTYNGELYNAAEVAAELAAGGVALRGRCDTEVLVEAVARWGLCGALARARGMWAFGLWDRRERTLSLVRDRLGEKPLFYGRAGQAVLFASELKALRAHPAFRPEVDRDALARYLRLGYLPAPECIYRGCAKVPAGSVVVVDADGTARPPERYWSIDDTVAAERRAAPLAARPRRSSSRPGNSCARRWPDACGPMSGVGVFLSGGVDSSTVAALAQAQGGSARTFTIAFDDPAVDEAAPAAAVARHLGTDHTEIPVTAADARAEVVGLAAHYDEPFADLSALPTLLLARAAAGRVTVYLSGDGGDEVWGGYNRYRAAQGTVARLLRLPEPARRALASALLALPVGKWDRAAAAARRVVPGRRQVRV